MNSVSEVRLIPRLSLLALALVALSGCAGTELPREAPALADMEEPLELHEEPADEGARRALPKGTFSGLVVADARRTLAAMESESAGVRVVNVIENSPADFAGLEEGDLVLLAVTPDGEREIRYPGDWRAVELETPPGTEVEVLYDRAALEGFATLTLEPRLRAADRKETRRHREERRVGVVLRTATEVEARAVGLPPGGGAVVVGLSRASPWRDAGLQFEDLIVAVGDEPVSDPRQVIEAVEAAEAGERLALTVRRGAEELVFDAAVAERQEELRTISIPFVFSRTHERGETETSVLWGLVRHRTTEVAWEWRLFWLISFSGGEQDRLVEESP